MLQFDASVGPEATRPTISIRFGPVDPCTLLADGDHHCVGITAATVDQAAIVPPG